jgi:hypothetical protein
MSDCSEVNLPEMRPRHAVVLRFGKRSPDLRSVRPCKGDSVDSTSSNPVSRDRPDQQAVGDVSTTSKMSCLFAIDGNGDDLGSIRLIE